MILEEDQIDLNEPPINFKTMLLIDNSTKLNEDNDNLKIQIEVCNICFLTNILKMLNLELPHQDQVKLASDVLQQIHSTR